MNLPGIISRWFDFERHEFTVTERPVTVIAPPEPLPGKRWAWKGEFLDAFPGTEIALLRRGFYIVYMNFQDQYGSPCAVAKWDELYKILTEQYGFAAKAALIGLSRGALYCYQWAIANPGKVACIFGDAPVCDMCSWPGGKGKGPGNHENWKQVLEVFGFRSEAEAMAWKGNPVDNLAPLARAGIPILHVYGDADKAVPWEENTAVVAERYRKLGGDIKLIGKPGCDHHPHGLEDPTPIVEFILRHTANSGPCKPAGGRTRSN